MLRSHRAGTLSGNQANTATGPAARNYGVVWLDAGDGFEGGASVRLWLWSGLGSRHDGDATGGYLDDLWSFSVADMHWTRHKPNAGPVASPSASRGERWLLADRPAAREWTNSWSDGKGKVWVFSGVASGPPPYHMGTPNDLWCMDSTATGGPTWTLIYNYSSMAGVYHGPPAQVHPGFREGSMTAYEPPTKAAPGGRLHLYGGMGAGTNASDWGNLQDTWAYDVARRRWEYIAGPSKPGGRPVFGTKGVVAAGNVPPGEHAGYDWPLVVDGRAYFLGGENGEEVPAMRNDLWAVRHLHPPRVPPPTSHRCLCCPVMPHRLILRTARPLCQYDVAAQQWAWMSGANVPNATARYGTRGVADASNVPGARYAGQGWATAGPSVACAGAGPELWLFGGYGYDIQGRRKYLSDVWTWRPVADDLPAC